MSKVSYKAISAADFFYRNRDIAGFDNPTRAIYTAVRELVENSLDACEDGGILPEIKVIMKNEGDNVYQITVEDNGIGVPRDNIQSCFGRILYGSKYTHRQARGRFGLGGKMAFLYGQITTHKPLHIISSAVDSEWVYDVKLRIDIQTNQPELIEWNRRKNGSGWHGTIIEFSLEGDWPRARKQIVEYIRETALITPYATILFVDPDGVLYYFTRSIKKLPPPPTEVQPHPVGVDVERVTRIIGETKTRDMVTFMRTHFHRVGPKTAQKFLKSVGIPENTDPKSLTTTQIVELVRKMKTFGEFLPPDAKCLSPLGEELLKSGIEKELKPDFAAVTQRPPSSYGGHPFIVEVGIAYGGEVPRKENIVLYRYANRIPLLYDEYKDVSAKVIRSIPWSRYKIKPGMPIAVFVPPKKRTNSKRKTKNKHLRKIPPTHSKRHSSPSRTERDTRLRKTHQKKQNTHQRTRKRRKRRSRGRGRGTGRGGSLRSRNGPTSGNHKRRRRTKNRRNPRRKKNSSNRRPSHGRTNPHRNRNGNRRTTNHHKTKKRDHRNRKKAENHNQNTKKKNRKNKEKIEEKSKENQVPQKNRAEKTTETQENNKPPLKSPR